MDFVKDVQALGFLTAIQLVGWFAALLSMLPPVLAVLPIPHTPHEWGVALSAAVLYVFRSKRRAARRVVVGKSPTTPGVPVSAPVVTRKARRAAAPAAEKHSSKMRKLAKP